MQWNLGALEYALTTGKKMLAILCFTQIFNLVICKGNRTEVSGVQE